MSAKRVLLVDDQRDVTRMLRSALETLGRSLVIVDVPSGEEAILEIARAGVDLLVTDVRLPGISGLDVVKRLRRSAPQAGVIVISGVQDTKAEAEARSLGVMAFYRKPVPMEAFIKMVEEALGSKPGTAPLPVLVNAEQPGVSDRLSTLRRDLGADAVFLLDTQGIIIVRAGDITKINIDPIMSEVTTAITASLKVSRSLHGLIPANVHFFDGDELDVYAANVGQYYALAIVFDGDRGAGQMGPVMRYGRQCADDLLNSLQVLGMNTPQTAQASRSAPTPAPSRPAPPSTPPGRPAVPPGRPAVPPARPAPATPPPAKPAANRPAPRPAPASVDHLVFKAAPDPKNQPAPTPPPPPPPLPEPEPVPLAPVQELSPEELKAFEDALFKAQATPKQSADDFWNTLESSELEPKRSGVLPWEQAEELGLTPKD